MGNTRLQYTFAMHSPGILLGLELMSDLSVGKVTPRGEWDFLFGNGILLLLLLEALGSARTFLHYNNIY